MKYTFIILFGFIYLNSYAQLPEGFVYAKEIIPDLDVELRYLGSNNFLGKPVEGYKANKLIVTKQTAKALKLVQETLQNQNLCLKVYDGYRPQQSVNHFIKWAKKLEDTINKQIYYPDVKKQNLFKEDYIAIRSGHSRGSTVDLTIIDGTTGVPLDMGSIFDFFGVASWVDYKNITLKQKSNRLLLQNVMLKHGFKNYSHEWWHFTLIEEPFPNTYFDFLVE